MNDPQGSRLEGRRVLITGSGTRLGRAVALDLGRRGCEVIVHFNRSERSAASVVAELAGFGARARSIGADLENERGVLALLDACWASGGAIDFLVNNASIFDPGSLADLTFEEIERNLRINTWAPFLLTRGIAARLDGEARGAVVNMLDTRIVGGDPLHPAYHVSKRMLADFTRMTAVEFAPRLRVNGVAPGAILPPPDEDETYLAERGAVTPMRVSGRSEDISDAVRYLLTAPFVTGEVIFVDGGQHLRPEG